MKQRAIGWMVLCFVLALAPAAWSAEPATAPNAPDADGFLGSSCAAASSEPYVFFVDDAELDPLGKARPVVNLCCQETGCCSLISTGCEACPQGGKRWYEKYACPGGGRTCKLFPITCPTAC